MHRTVTRRAVLAAGLTALAGCVGNLSGDEPPTADPSSSQTTSTSTTTEVAADAPPTSGTQLPRVYSSENLQDATHTGAQKDAIPAIDEPSFVASDGADVQDDDIVFGIAMGDTVRAYPQKILVWHEIVNDVIDEMPVAVSYCPLTGTVLGFERGKTTFGVSGKLVNNNLVMYDHETGSWWSQILATAFKGPHDGNSLRQFPLVWTRWRHWRTAYPETTVLSRETGYVRNYNTDPYGDYSPMDGYYEDRNTLFRPIKKDDRYHPKKVFVGTRAEPGIAAVEKSTVDLDGTVRAGDYLAVHDADLDAVFVYHNPDGLEFERRDGQIHGPDGTDAGRDLPLDQVMAFDAMWFAWAGFYPDTAVYP